MNIENIRPIANKLRQNEEKRPYGFKGDLDYKILKEDF